MTPSIFRRAVLPLAIVSSIALAACGSEDPLAEQDADPGDEAGVEDTAEEAPVAGGLESVTVGGADFTEMRIMQEMYAALLSDAGYETEIVSPGSREIYAPALVDGQIDVVPEYAATMAEYLNRDVNGPEAEAIATNDAATTVEAMRPLAEEQGLVVLEPAEAASQNGFAILQALANEQGISTLSEFAAFMPEIRLSAVEECAERPFCEPGLEEVYGFDVTEILPLGFGSPQAKEAVVAGAADMALVGTTDATLEADGLVLLEDDKDLQLADNLVPVVTEEAAADETLVEALNSLSEVLTTEDLTELNRRVDVERELASDVAQSYLEEEGLIG